MICETEFQALARALSSSWGKFTDLLLKGFQNETVRARRASRQPVTIPRPAPSIALSGTPSAFEEVISRTDDGLFSRFLLYKFEADLKWTPQFRGAGGPSSQDGASPRPTGPKPTSDPLQGRLAAGARQHRALCRRLGAREAPLFVRGPSPLQQVHTRTFKSITRKWAASSVTEGLWASLTRTGLQAVKIASLLRVLRGVGREAGPAASGDGEAFGEEIALGPADMEAGLRLALTYLPHAMEVEKRLGPGGSGPNGSSPTGSEKAGRLGREGLAEDPRAE